MNLSRFCQTYHINSIKVLKLILFDIWGHKTKKFTPFCSRLWLSRLIQLPFLSGLGESTENFWQKRLFRLFLTFCAPFRHVDSNFRVRRVLAFVLCCFSSVKKTKEALDGLQLLKCSWRNQKVMFLGVSGASQYSLLLIVATAFLHSAASKALPPDSNAF